MRDNLLIFLIIFFITSSLYYILGYQEGIRQIENIQKQQIGVNTNNHIQM